MNVRLKMFARSLQFFSCRYAMSLASMLIIASVALPVGAQNLPAMNIKQGKFMPPSTSYGSSTVHTFGLPSAQTDALANKRPVEIKELAKGLGATQALPPVSAITQDEYTRRVYEYVRQNIETTFMFGLQKGALGALIDQSGTPFDQAQLMVELLREGGISASYKIGNISLAGAADFTPWTGISDANAACRLLADGGIPGSVNGSSDADCVGISGAITTVTMRHIWVSVGSKLYDPSFKKYTWKTGIDVAAALGCGTSTSPTCASKLKLALLANQSPGSIAGAPSYQSLNQGAFEDQLQTFAKTGLTWIRNNNPNSLVEDIVGGKTINLASIAIPAATLPYGGAGANVSSVPAGSDIPDQYRTRLSIQFDNIIPSTSHTTFFMDELSGKHVRLFRTSLSPSTRDVALYVDFELIAISSRSGWTSDNCLLTLSIDHPYAALNGTYMDDTTTQLTGLEVPAVINGISQFWIASSLTIIASSGSTGSGSVKHFGNVARRSNFNWNFKDPYGLIYTLNPIASNCMGVDLGGNWGGSGQPVKLPAWYSSPITQGLVSYIGCTQGQQAPLAANWLAQNSRTIDLVGSINSTRILKHHILGFVVTGDYTSIGAISGFSVISTKNDALDIKATNFSIASLSSHLEGSVIHQGDDGFEGWSATSKLVRANEHQIPLLLTDSTNFISGVRPTLAAYGYPASELDRIQRFVDAGYSVALPRNWMLGNWTVGDIANCCLHNVNPAGGGRIAYTVAGNSISHLMFGDDKGGNTAGSNNPVEAVNESIKLMDGSQKGRKYFAVDLASGALRFDPPADLTVGAGDFPNSLSFKRYLNTSSIVDLSNTLIFTGANWEGGMANLPYNLPTPSENDRQLLVGGMDFNFNIRASLGSDVLQALGEDSAIDAVSSIAAIFSLRDLNRVAAANARDLFAPQITSAFVTYKWGRTLLNNSVVVTRPPQSTTFLRLPDDSFNPPPNSAEALKENGARIGPFGVAPRPDQMVYGYGGVTYALTGTDGSVLTLGIQHCSPQYLIQLDSTAGSSTHGPPSTGICSGRSFDARQWTFPNGIVVNFRYATRSYLATDNAYGNLAEVSNNLGYKLTFAGWYQGLGQPAVGGVQPDFVFRVSDAAGRTVRVGDACGFGVYFCFAVTTPDGKKTGYQIDYSTYSAVDTAYPGYPIVAIYSPTDVSEPYLRLQYDSLMRVASTSYAPNNTNGTRSVYNYFIGGLSLGETLHRGESVDPLDAHNTSIFGKNSEELQNIDAIGRITTKTYDTRQRLKSVIAPEGNSTEYTYDIRSNVLTEKHLPKAGSAWAATTTINTYMEGSTVVPCVNPAVCNKLKTTTDLLNRVVTTFDYYKNPALLSNGQLMSIKGIAVGGAGAETDLCYSDLAINGTTTNLLTGKVDVVGTGKPNRVSKFAYDANNHLLLSSARIDPTDSLTTACAATTKSSGQNLTTVFTFDALGNVRTVNGPRTDANDITTYTFDLMRRLTEVDVQLGTDPQYGVTKYEYYADGTLWTTSRKEIIAGASTWRTESRTYWPSGDLQTVTDPENNISYTNYDLAGRANLVTDPDGRSAGTVFNSAGQTLCSWKGITNGAAPTSCAWNPAAYASAGNNGPYRYVSFDSYSLNGKPLSTTDANNNTTQLVYDKFDRPRYTLFPSPVSGIRCTERAAETVGNLTCPADPDGIVRATYEELRYSSNGNPTGTICSGNDQVCVKRTRSNKTITYSYDTMSRVASKAVTGLPTVTFAYNLLSEPLSVTSPSQTSPAIPQHSIAYDYNDLGRKLYEENRVNGTVRRVSYDYDAAGNRKGTTWPDGYRVTYEYDDLNRMSRVWEGDPTAAPTSAVKLADYSYDTLSRRTGLQYQNQPNNRTTYSYEPDSNLNVLSHFILNGTIPTTVALDYDHNRTGQITSIDAADAFYLPSPSASSTTAFVPNKLNQYNTVGGQALTYDPSGNLLTWYTTGGKQTYTYDSENRLRTAAINGSTTASITYDYDPLGRRLSKTVSGTGTYFLLDGDEEIAEYNASGAVLRRYITGPAIDDRIARVEGSSLSNPPKYYYHVNHQGSVIDMTDNTGLITQQLAYDEYGLLTSQLPASITGEQYRYTGRRFDSETGLYYYRARYYSPVLGRFLQTDPIGYKNDFNLYDYVGNDPLDRVDPSGKDFREFLERQAPEFVVLGDAFAGDAAFIVGKVTGDEALVNAALDGLSENRQSNINMAIAFVGTTRSGAGQKTYTTYTRLNPLTGQVRPGRTSGTGTPEQQVANRAQAKDHKELTKQGYLPPVVDKNSANADAIRGREQVLTHATGGAQSKGGTSGAKIDGIAEGNPKKEHYMETCKKEFGCGM